MAQTISNKFKKLNTDGTIILGTTTLTMGLLKGTTGQTLSVDFPTALDPDRNFISDLVAIVAEATATAYARVALTTVTTTEDDANNRMNADSDNVVFPTIGGASNNFIIGCFIFAPGANDGARPLVAVYELTELPTNGSDITVTVADFARLT